jgi:hypothetical protein
MREFLESVPPGTTKRFSTVNLRRNTPYNYKYLVTPEIALHCDDESCSGIRFFEAQENEICPDKPGDCSIVYVCRNCNRTTKRFSLHIRPAGMAWDVTKFGEIPAFGPHTPARALKLIGSDRDLFLQGRRCENQGLGIGAFTYYRRVIEDQRSRIFDEMIRVLETTDPTSEVIDELKSAKLEQQFSKSVDKIKHAMPASLLINGQNPLKLLHSALSEGVHALSDARCLELAKAVRTLLFEFSERMAQALKDDAELASAVAVLNRLGSQKKP